MIVSFENGIDPNDIGITQADHELYRPAAPIQICSIQTLARRGMPRLPLYVVDEAHIFNKALVEHLKTEEGQKITVCGLSASPWAIGLGRTYDDLIKPIDMSELITQGYLSRFRVFAPTHPKLHGVKTDLKSGDYQVGGLAEVMSEPTLVADIVSNWLDKGENRPTLCFAVNRAHAALLHEQFERAGVSSAYVDAFTSREERGELGKRFQNGEIKVICNIGTMTTGVDLDVRCIIFARPTKSEMLFCQIIGRGLRPKANGEDCLIFDHSDTHLRLGMVTDVGRDTLDCGIPSNTDAPREHSTPLPKECTSCGCLVPAAARECPSCGTAMRRSAGIKTVDGDLLEITPRNGPPGPRRKNEPVKIRLMKMGRTEIFGQIKYLGRERGWSEGRMAHCYRDIFDSWPNGQRGAPEAQPCPELLSWVRSKAIAWAKGKAKQGHDLMNEAARNAS